MKTRSHQPGLPDWFLLAVVLAAGVLAHVASVRAPFVFDDGLCVRDNYSIIFLDRLGDVLWPPVTGSGVSGRPLVNLTLALNYAWGGLDPHGYHVFNVVLHALVGGLLFSVTSRLLRVGQRGFPADDSRPSWVACAVAVLWVVHPLQTESVASVIQRTEILGGFFYLLTLWCFVRGIGSARAAWWHAGAVGACLVGMAAKEIMFTAPFVVLLIDRAFWSGSFREAWRQRARLYLGLACTWLLLAWILYLMGGTRGNAAGFGTGAITWWSYFFRQWEAICTYLKLVFWPHPLILDYGCDVVWSVREVVWQGAFLFLIGGLTVLGVVRNHRWAVPAAAFFLILGPSSSVMPLPGQTMAEHRMYLPLAGALILIVLGAARLGGRSLVWMFPLVALSLAGVSVARNLAYASPLQLWLDVIKARPFNVRAYYNAGDAFFEQQRWDEAAAHYAAALRIDPKCTGAWCGIGNIELRRQNFAEAIRCYERALAIEPDFTDAVSNLGSALWAVGRRDEGIASLRRLIQLRPEFPNAHFNLGTLLLLSGNVAEAQRCFEQTIRLLPTHAQAYNNLGTVFLQSGRPREAERCFKEALRLLPGYSDAAQNLVTAQARR